MQLLTRLKAFIASSPLGAAKQTPCTMLDGPSNLILALSEQEWPEQPSVFETEETRVETRRLESHLDRIQFDLGTELVLSQMQECMMVRLGRFSSL